ncbi:hypothetical protein ACP4OV_012503 [Aristida adscensionis]
MAPIDPGPQGKAPPALPDHLLQEIFVRIASPADLVRASAACASFRGLIADPSFLRRYRSLHRHPPLFLGLVDQGIEGFVPVDAPHPNALAARALAHAADFSFDYLPRRSWSPWDARDGRLLLGCSAAGAAFCDLAVCDPLYRGYVLLPPIPDDLVASVLDQVKDAHSDNFDAFLVPSQDYEDTQFRVIGLTYCRVKAVVFVYSSVSGHWTVGAPTNWDDLGLIGILPDGIPLGWCPSYAYGCFYWKVPSRNQLLKLDINRMEFSTVVIPFQGAYQDIVVVVEAPEGRLGMLSHNSALPYLYYIIRQNDGEGANYFQVETTISVPWDVSYIAGVAEGYIFLRAEEKGETTFFSLDGRTLKFERLCAAWLSCYIIPYFGFPPFMSPRRI